jgi:predicted nuclease of predicted toxin-antitoxin system
LVDMPLSPELAQWLRAEGHTAVHANELSMNRSPDAEILQAAVRDDCVVITADLDFPRLLAKLGSTGPGLILLRGIAHCRNAVSLMVRRRWRVSQ